MKKTTLLCLLALCCFLGRAQYEDSLSRAIAQSINSGKDTLLFNLFDSTFQTQFPLAEVHKAIPQLQNLLGEISQVRYVSRKDSEYVYRLTGAKTPFHVIISCTRQHPQQLTAMLFSADNPFFEIIKRSQLKTDNPRKTSLDRYVDSVVRSRLAQTNTPGVSIGVLYKGKTYRYDYGETQRDNGHLPAPGTVYEIGSLTKTFTATVLARLVRQGKLSLDDPLNRYLPDSLPQLQFDGEPVRIRHLLTHTSGLPFSTQGAYGAQRADDIHNPVQYNEMRHIFANLENLKLTEKPGTRFSYSNMGFAVLGYICEKLTQKPIEDLYREYIFTPLGMNHSFAHNVQEMGDISGYVADGSPVPFLQLKAYTSAGGIRSTVDDLLRYLQAQVEEGSSELGKDITLTHHSLFEGPNDRLAMSWFWSKEEQGVVYMHSGSTSGFTSKSLFIPQQKVAVVVLSNCKNDNAETISHAILDYVKSH